MYSDCLGSMPQFLEVFRFPVHLPNVKDVDTNGPLPPIHTALHGHFRFPGSSDLNMVPACLATGQPLFFNECNTFLLGFGHPTNLSVRLGLPPFNALSAAAYNDFMQMLLLPHIEPDPLFQLRLEKNVGQLTAGSASADCWCHSCCLARRTHDLVCVLDRFAFIQLFLCTGHQIPVLKALALCTCFHPQWQDGACRFFEDTYLLAYTNAINADGVRYYHVFWGTQGVHRLWETVQSHTHPSLLERDRCVSFPDLSVGEPKLLKIRQGITLVGSKHIGERAVAFVYQPRTLIVTCGGMVDGWMMDNRVHVIPDISAWISAFWKETGCSEEKTIVVPLHVLLNQTYMAMMFGNLGEASTRGRTLLNKDFFNIGGQVQTWSAIEQRLKLACNADVAPQFAFHLFEWDQIFVEEPEFMFQELERIFAHHNLGVTFVHTAITWLTSLLHLPTKCMHHVVMKRFVPGSTWMQLSMWQHYQAIYPLHVNVVKNGSTSEDELNALPFLHFYLLHRFKAAPDLPRYTQVMRTELTLPPYHPNEEAFFTAHDFKADCVHRRVLPPTCTNSVECLQFSRFESLREAFCQRALCLQAACRKIAASLKKSEDKRAALQLLIQAEIAEEICAHPELHAGMSHLLDWVTKGEAAEASLENFAAAQSVLRVNCLFQWELERVRMRIEEKQKRHAELSCLKQFVQQCITDDEECQLKECRICFSNYMEETEEENGSASSNALGRGVTCIPPNFFHPQLNTYIPEQHPPIESAVGTCCVLHCGHTLCFKCLMTSMAHKDELETVPCPFCRVPTPLSVLITVETPRAQQYMRQCMTALACPLEFLAYIRWRFGPFVRQIMEVLFQKQSRSVVITAQMRTLCSLHLAFAQIFKKSVFDLSLTQSQQNALEKLCMVLTVCRIYDHPNLPPTFNPHFNADTPQDEVKLLTLVASSPASHHLPPSVSDELFPVTHIFYTEPDVSFADIPLPCGLNNDASLNSVQEFAVCFETDKEMEQRVCAMES